MEDYQKQILSFIDNWPGSPERCRTVFVALMEWLLAQEETTLEFYARPGVSYSLRAVHHNRTRPLYAMVDVIDDEPRWLSVCFYADMVTDPEGRGNIVPGGLLGEDGLCFDVEDLSAGELDYLKKRMGQAHAKVTDESSS